MLKNSKKAQEANQKIGKSMNVIRFITEHQYFNGAFINIIEASLTPLLRYAQDPSVIDFEDDLVFFIDALLNKSQGCSQTLAEIFPYLKKFQNKYQGMLANLTGCLNAYIYYGGDLLFQNQDNVNVLIEIISEAISLKPIGSSSVNFSNNIEGCLVLQIAFQNLNPGSSSFFHQNVPNILSGIIDIIQSK